MSMILHGTVSDNTVALDRKTVPPIFINGDMGIWQRGTALASASGTYACDRFWYAGTGATSQRSTEVPSGFVYSNKLTYGSSDMSIGQPIEFPATGKQGIFIAGQTVTIAFYGKVDSGTEGISVNLNARNEKFSGTNSTAFTISDNAVTLTTAWQRFTKTFTIPTINANNVMIAFELGGISKTAYFTGFQCELGTYDSNSIADFQFEDISTSLARCQRYFQKSFPQGTTPQNYSSYVAGQSDNSIGATMSSTEFKTVITLKCEMRSAPTITYYRAQNTPEDGEWTFFDGGDKLNPSSMASNSQTHRFTAVLTYSSGLTAGNSGLCQGNYKADAEL